jgi:hypothetical protein
MQGMSRNFAIPSKDKTYKSWGFKEERESPRYQKNNQQNNTRKLPKL